MSTFIKKQVHKISDAYNQYFFKWNNNTWKKTNYKSINLAKDKFISIFLVGWSFFTGNTTSEKFKKKKNNENNNNKLINIKGNIFFLIKYFWKWAKMTRTQHEDYTY